MQFIDKVMNRVLKWENVDVTIPEMLDLIQTELLETLSDKDLAELKKGMQKTFVLAVGGGSWRRFYPSFYTSVRLCLEFNVLTHQLHCISLQDTINKKEYFIPTGKASCTKLQSGVLRRMAQPGHGGASIGQSPGYSGRYSDKTPEAQTRVADYKYAGKKAESDARLSSMSGQRLPQNDKWTDFEASWTGTSAKTPFSSAEPRSANAKGGRFQRQRPSRLLPVMGILCAALFLIGLGFGGSQLLGRLMGNSGMDYIAVVQNGYLGNNTDLTVMELFDGHYGALGYQKGIWADGQTDSGHQIVELRYAAADEIREEIRIQFHVLEEGCFRVNRINHFLFENEKPSDTYYILNYICYMQHLMNNPEIVGDPLKEYGYVALLNSTPCYTVRYGASADYLGNRERLYQKFDDDPLELSSAMLLDLYGLLDLSYYYPDSTEETAPTETPTQPETTPVETIPETTTQTEPVPATEPPAKQTERIGYVLESSGGLNIRNGPGRDYAEIGRLAPNAQITVYETLVVGTANWGRIGEGQWVCIDYVMFSDDTMYTANSLPFSIIPKEYIFTSGAGGWGTNLTIFTDGSFIGRYHDSDMGVVGEGYPRGTAYYCDFGGKFSTPLKVNEFTYKMELEAFWVAEEEGYEYIQDEIRYIASGPYGFDGPNEYYIYLPGIPSAMMPRNVYEWVSRLYGTTDQVYVICSANGELPFMGS